MPDARLQTSQRAHRPSSFVSAASTTNPFILSIQALCNRSAQQTSRHSSVVGGVPFVQIVRCSSTCLQLLAWGCALYAYIYGTSQTFHALDVLLWRFVFVIVPRPGAGSLDVSKWVVLSMSSRILRSIPVRSMHYHIRT
jgi:hypothetical protein